VDSLSILNYQGSKRNLLPFIKNNSTSVISSGQTVLDIFAGTCSVGYSFKRTNRIFANDCEKYAYTISKALLGSYSEFICSDITSDINLAFDKGMEKINKKYGTLANEEVLALKSEDATKISEFYHTIPTVWNGKIKEVAEARNLFLQYYSSSYFGLSQSAEIDSLRVAIEKYKNTKLFAPLMAALYYAMKECVFAKDGHMAQPLGFEKNIAKLLKQRQKSIFALFNAKFEEFFFDDFVVTNYENECFNMNFEDLLQLPKIRNEVDVIYADPPYTDMQYSRYYHILNFVTQYKPVSLTMVGGTHTKGLYTDGRYQSKLSIKSKCLDTFAALVDFCSDFQKNLVVSFAYPADTALQKTDRYVMSIDSLVSMCAERFGTRKVDVHSCEYTHSNNRNSEQKKVLEYLVVCKKN